MRSKYIVGEVFSGQIPVLAAIVFPESIDHRQMAQVCADGVGGVESAGFFRVVDGQVEPYGESMGLQLGSRPKDALLIAKAIGLHERSR